MKKTLLGICVCLLIAVACSKKEEVTVPTDTVGEVQAEINMLAHLKNMNKIICEAMATESPEKTVADCVDQLNTLSEMNPENNEIKIYEASAKKCVDYLKTVQGSDIIIQSTSGPCALTALQGS